MFRQQDQIFKADSASPLKRLKLLQLNLFGDFFKFFISMINKFNTLINMALY